MSKQQTLGGLIMSVLNSFGLESYSDYRGCQVEVRHGPSGKWFPLLRTADKVLYYEDEDENERRMPVKSLDEVNFIKGKENTVPGAIEKKNESPAQVEIVEGLLSNKYYRGSDLYVKHIDKGWRELVRTSNKVIYYLEDGKERRMTLAKFGGVKELAEPAPFPESPDTFFDNFDFAMVG